MTAEPNLPQITCPSSLVASCAPLLGFVPHDCLVAFIHGVPGRRSPVILRVDLPEPHRAEEHSRSVSLSIAGTGGVAVDLVAWVDAEDSARRDQLPSTALVDSLAVHLTDIGLDVAECGSTNGRSWWSHLCDDPSCCPPESTQLDPAVMSQVQAEFVYAGYAPLASREALGERLERDEVRAAQVGRRLAGNRDPKGIERWRTAQISALTRLMVPVPGLAQVGSLPLGPVVAARIHRALADTPVRDTVLLRLIASRVDDPEPWVRTIEVLCDAVRCAPEGSAAPAATLLALVAWMRGEGALGMVALERSRAEDPTYRLASLAGQMMVRGTDPRMWRTALSGLTEAECRNPGRSWQARRG